MKDESESESNSENKYEIINTIPDVHLSSKKSKQTWKEYFRKLYIISIILSASIILYFYYYGKEYYKNTN